MYIRMFATLIISLYTSRIILSSLGFEDYGLYNVIGGIIVMFSFVCGGMYNATSRYITFYLGKSDIESVRRVFSTSLFIHLVFSIIIIVLGETLGLWYLENKLVIPHGRENAAMWLYQLSIASMVMGLINVPYQAVIIAKERMSAFAYLSIMDVILKLLIVVILPFYPFDKLIFYGSLLFAVSVLDRLIYGWYCNRNFIESKIKWVWDFDLFKEMVGFAGWGILGTMTYIFSNEGVNLLINSFFGTTVNAARGIGMHLENTIGSFASNIQTAINPQIVKSFANDDKERMLSLMYSSSRYCYFLLLLLSIPAWVTAPFLLKIWLGAYPDHTIYFFRLTVICVILDSLVNPLWCVNNATGDVKKYQLYVNGSSLLFLPIIYIALKITYWPEIVYYLLLVSRVVALIIRIVIVKCQVGFSFHSYFSGVVFPISKVTLLVLPMAIWFALFMHDYTWPSFVISLSCLLSVLIITIGYIGLNKKERLFVIGKIKNKISRKK